MPNWCVNRLTVRGSLEDLDRFMEHSERVPEYYYECGWANEERRKSPYFSFSGLHPIPERVLREQNRQKTIHAKAVAEWEAAKGEGKGENDKGEQDARFRDYLPPEYDEAALRAWYK